MARKRKTEIPFSASVSRDYGNGNVRSTVVSGTYHNTQTADVEAKAAPCEHVPDDEPCSD